MYARGGGSFRCVLCATGGVEGSKNQEKNAYVINGRPQPEINQNITLKWRQVSNIKSTMVGFWLDFGCLTSQPDFNHGTTLKSGCVPSGN